MQVSMGLESVAVNILGYHIDSQHPNVSNDLLWRLLEISSFRNHTIPHNVFWLLFLINSFWPLFSGENNVLPVRLNINIIHLMWLHVYLSEAGGRAIECCRTWHLLLWLLLDGGRIFSFLWLMSSLGRWALPNLLPLGTEFLFLTIFLMRWFPWILWIRTSSRKTIDIFLWEPTTPLHQYRYCFIFMINSIDLP